jgi:chloramphenicol 3-O-phosphotransferase
MSAAVLITGAPGAGKSATLDALATLLDVEGVEYGALEAEQLAWGNPWLPFGEAVGQLEEVLTLQRRAGRRLFLLAAGVESVDELGMVVEATRADPVLVACLRAGPESVARRLQEREPDGWPGKRDLIARAYRLAGAVHEIAGIDLVIDTEASPPPDVAREIRAAMATQGILSGGG